MRHQTLKPSQMFTKCSTFTTPAASCFLYLPSLQGLPMFALQLLLIFGKVAASF